METIDLNEIEDGLKEMLNILDTEWEGNDCLRLDLGRERSIWLYENGQITGEVPVKARKFLRDNGFTI